MFWPSYLNTPGLATVSGAPPPSPAFPGGPPTHPSCPGERSDLSPLAPFDALRRALVSERIAPLADWSRWADVRGDVQRIGLVCGSPLGQRGVVGAGGGRQCGKKKKQKLCCFLYLLPDEDSVSISITIVSELL